MTIRYLVIANPDGDFKPRRWLDKTLKNKAAVFFHRRQACPSVQAGFATADGVVRK